MLDGKQMSQEEFKFHWVQSRMPFLPYTVNTLCADNICVTSPSVLIYVYPTFATLTSETTAQRGSRNEERKPDLMLKQG